MSCYMTASQFLSSKSLRPGDLIEIDRGSYRHWAMYSNKPGFVFNVDSQEKTESLARITLERLETVAESSLVRKNNQDHAASARGLQKLSAQQAIHNASKVLGTNVPYNVFGRNCEYYCTEFKYSEGFSKQVEKESAKAIATVTAATVGGVYGGPVGATTCAAAVSVLMPNDDNDNDVCEESNNLTSSSSESPCCKQM